MSLQTPLPDPTGWSVIILAGEFAGNEGVCLGRAIDGKKWLVSPEGSDRVIGLEFGVGFGILLNRIQERGSN